MNILCSGNPADKTIASGIKGKFANASFASRTTGFDLRFWDEGSEDFFRKKINNYDVFINSSFLCSWCQNQLLEVVFEEWSNHNIYGHIINIGSSAEWEGKDSEFGLYTIQKEALRKRSIQLNNKNNIKVTHLILDGINDGKPGHETWLAPSDIADNIFWVLHNKLSVPILGLI